MSDQRFHGGDGRTAPNLQPGSQQAGVGGGRAVSENPRKMASQGLPEPRPVDVPTTEACTLAPSEVQGTSQSSASRAVNLVPTSLKPHNNGCIY